MENRRSTRPSLSRMVHSREVAHSASQTVVKGTQMFAMQRLSGYTYAQPVVIPAALSEAQDGAPDAETNEASGAQDKRLSGHEIDALEEGGIDVHELKQKTTGDKKVSKYDLFKDKDGNIHVKPKKDKGPGEPTGYNINDFFRDVFKKNQ